MKKLLKVTAEFEFVIAVGDDDNEHDICERWVAEALKDTSKSDVIFTTETYYDGCVDGWDGELEPYNGEGRSTDEWLSVKDA